MAYLAIARKWRPQRFEDIVGQGHVTRTLQNAIQLGRVHHAFLFTGARGVGKTTAARILAKALNCEQGPTPTPCNQCKSCQEITAGIARDVHEIDAASNTGVDSVREIRDNLRYLPSSGKHKIYIIDEVHMLSTAAFNALLKTLEEPPPHVVFIFATTDPQKVPDTILSRCQRFDFKRIPLKQIAEKLAEIAHAEGVRISEAAVLMISREAEGSMRDAQSLLDQVLASAGNALEDSDVVEILGLIDRRLIFDCLSGVLEHTPERGLETIERIYGFGFDLKQFTRELLEVVRHLNVVKISKEAERFVDVSAEELSQLRTMAGKLSVEELSRHFSILLQGYDEIARSEAPRLVLEMTILRMAQVRPVQPLDELLARLAQLESAVRGGAAARPAGGGPSGSPVSRPVGGPGPGASSGPAASGGSSAGSPGSSRPGPAFGSTGAGTASAAPGSRPSFVPPASRSNPFAGDSRPAPSSRPEFNRPLPATGDQGRGNGSGGFAPPIEPEGDSDDEDHGEGPDPSSSGRGGGAAAFSRPGAPAGPPGRSLLGPEVSARWLRFMEFVAQQPGSQDRIRFLKQAEPVKDEGERILLGFRNNLLQRQAEKEVGDPELSAQALQHFGGPVSFACMLLAENEPAGQSFRAFEEEQEKRRREGIRETELAQPRVKLATAVFGVDLREVRVEIEPLKP